MEWLLKVQAKLHIELLIDNDTKLLSSGYTLRGKCLLFGGIAPVAETLFTLLNAIIMASFCRRMEVSNTIILRTKRETSEKDENIYQLEIK